MAPPYIVHMRFSLTPVYTALVFSFSHSASSAVKYGDIFSYTAL